MKIKIKDINKNIIENEGDLFTGYYDLEDKEIYVNDIIEFRRDYITVQSPVIYQNGFFLIDLPKKFIVDCDKSDQIVKKFLFDYLPFAIKK